MCIFIYVYIYIYIYMYIYICMTNFLPPLHPPRSKNAVGNVLVLLTHPFLSHSPSIHTFLLPFLLCCPRLFANLYIFSSVAVARRGRCVSVVFAPAPPPLVLAHVAAAVVFVCDPLAPQSLHLLRRWCSQMPPQSQSLHRLLSRWCSQILLPLQSFHLLFSRL